MEDLIKEKLFAFFTKFKLQQYKEGEVMIHGGYNPSSVYYLKEGIVRQYYISKKGEEITLNMFKPHSFFPMSWIISNIPNNYYYEAMTDSVIYKAPKDAVLEFMKKEPDIVFDLLRRMYIGIEGLWMHIEYLSAGNALSKIVSTLLILGKRFGKEDKNGVTIPMKITEKELGQYAGMNRETVSRELHILKEKGFIFYNRGFITIPDIQKVEEALTL